MIAARAFGARGRGGLVLGPLHFELRTGGALAVLGTAGSGKSLLLAALAGLVPHTGELVREGLLAMVFQRDALDDSVTAVENVVLAARARGIPDPEEAARAALTRVGLGDDLHKLPRALSGGMRRRVGIARALAVSPDVLLADDPTAGLDPETAHEVLALLLGSSARSVVIATQDVDVVLPRVQAALVLDNGKQAWLGNPESLASATGLALFAARRFDVEAAWT